MIIGGISCLFFVGAFILVGIINFGSADPEPITEAFYRELLPILILLIVATVGYVISMRRSSNHILGAGLLIGAGVAMFLTIFITKQGTVQGLSGGLIYGVPFTLTGGILLGAALQQAKHAKNDN